MLMIITFKQVCKGVSLSGEQTIFVNGVFSLTFQGKDPMQ